ncbi:MAG: 3-dehydroquinate synthase [Deltaproteobacteria bacterium]|nr:3-dehydroquinate synthase [Deltaproteobacteria bacterium]
MRKVTVELGDRAYDILIDHHSLSKIGLELSKRVQPSQVAVVSDETVAALYSEQVLRSLDKVGIKATRITFPAGEKSKSLVEYGRLIDRMIERGIDRKSAVIALGGGVTGDLAGFASACYMRGISYVQAPTSLLAMVDSSVGGKTGIDHPLAKNLIGAFYQPRLVFADTATLDTLPAVEFHSGMAEAIKHGVIRDSGYFSFIENNREAILNRDPEVMEYLIAKSCQIKAEVVGADEREAGFRAILNFGHTAGHAIEALTNYKGYRHGEAVSVGMVIASQIAREVCGFSKEETARLRDVLNQVKLPTTLAAAPELSAESILKAMYSDKKTEGGTLRFVLPVRIGETQIVQVTDEALIKSAIESVSY